MKEFVDLGSVLSLGCQRTPAVQAVLLLLLIRSFGVYIYVRKNLMPISGTFSHLREYALILLICFSFA